MQCIGEAFGVDPTDAAQQAQYSTKPASLTSIFDVYLKTKSKQAKVNLEESSGNVTGSHSYVSTSLRMLVRLLPLPLPLPLPLLLLNVSRT